MDIYPIYPKINFLSVCNRQKYIHIFFATQLSKAKPGMVINAFKKAFQVTKPQILNSDEGCQFASQRYIDFIKENGIRQSMDEKRRWADNIMIERQVTLSFCF
ncbi:MAG: hypothetical protein Q4C84_04400 [Bacillota bacterium]|nr:hypothetical protein [Bacillota bacterium]